MKKFKVGQILNRVKDAIVIEDGLEYKRLTIRMYHKGVCLRDIELGENIGTKSQFVAQGGQFIMSRIDARNGAFGVIPESIDQAAITNDFLTFTVNEDLVNIDFFELYSQTDDFMQLCIEGSKGTTNRKRLKEEVFLDFEVYLPDVKDQAQLVNKAKKLQRLNERLNAELFSQNDLMLQLRQSILQEAIQGKLVPQDPNDEPASVLLEKIKTEKEQLINDNKIKKEKQLPLITDDEIPFELPKGWEWVRLGSLSTFENGDRSNIYPKEHELVNEGIPFINTKNIKDSFINLEDSQLTFITEEKFNSLRSGKLKNNDFLFVLRGSVGKMGIFQENHKYKTGFINAQLLIVRMVGEYNNEFLRYYFNSNLFNEQITQKSSGSAQPQLSASNMQNFIIPVPPLKEQKHIVEKVDKLMALCDELRKTVEQSKQESEMLMQSVLQEAFRVTEKEDNVIEFPSAYSNDIEDWEIAARSDGDINANTKAKIKNRVTELLGKSQQ